MRVRWHVLATLFLSVPFAACSDDEGPEPTGVHDASIDAATDASRDATIDAAKDAAKDAALDASVGCPRDCAEVMGMSCNAVRYDETLARISSHCVDAGTVSYLYLAEGTCSDGKRWISSGNLGTLRSFFDTNGALVGAFSQSDAIDLVCYGKSTWGDITCPGEARTRVICGNSL